MAIYGAPSIHIMGHACAYVGEAYALYQPFRDCDALGTICIGCWHLLGYSILCACWIGVWGLFGKLLCPIKLYEGLLCVDGCKWRVGVAICQFCGLGKVYS